MATPRWSRPSRAPWVSSKLFNAELQYAQSQGQLFFALINVYKSMGGGWVVEADRMTDAAGMEKTLP